MIRHKSTLAMFAALTFCVALPGAAAESERVVEGRAHFSRGVEYYKDGDFRNAMVEFKRAYEFAPNYKILYNLGQTGQELQDYAFALKSLEQYLADGGNEIRADRRAEVSATVRKLRQRVAEVIVNTTTPDADVFVDDLPAGRTPLPSPLVVSAGHRKITVTKGSMSATRVVDVAGGEKTEISLEPAERAAAASEPTPSESTHEANSASSDTATDRVNNPPSAASASAETESHSGKGGRAVWIGVAVTGALAVTAGVTGTLAVMAKHDFDSTMGRYPITPDDVSDARNKTRRLALVTDILGGAAILSCGVTIWIAASGGRDHQDESKHVGITLAPNGVVARGHF